MLREGDCGNWGGLRRPSHSPALCISAVETQQSGTSDEIPIQSGKCEIPIQGRTMLFMKFFKKLLWISTWNILSAGEQKNTSGF